MDFSQSGDILIIKHHKKALNVKKHGQSYVDRGAHHTRTKIHACVNGEVKHGPYLKSDALIFGNTIKNQNKALSLGSLLMPKVTKFLMCLGSKIYLE